MSELRRRLLYAKPKEVPNYLCFTALEDGTFTFTYPSNVAPDKCHDISYSLDGTNWTTLLNVQNQEVSFTTPLVHAGEKVYWKGTGPCASYGTANAKFSSSGKFDVSGHIASLLYGKNYDKEKIVTTLNFCFKGLFQGTKVVNASDLVLIDFNNNTSVYEELFDGCSNLVSIPNINIIPNPKSNTFKNSFRNCVILETIPNIEFNDCASVPTFYGCVKLKETHIKIKICRGSFFECFKGCTNLKKANIIIIDSITSNNCFQNCFVDCINLSDVSLDIPNLTNFIFLYTFRNCTSLQTAPKLPFKTLTDNCYQTIFYNCTNLNYIKMLATDISAPSCLQNWVGSVQTNSGVFVKHIDATWDIRGANGVPNNWIIIYYDPTLDKYYTDQTRTTECDDHGNPI